MSGIVRPKGGAPPSVYWRRRLILLAVVLLVIAGGFKLFGGGGDDGEDTEPQASPSSSVDNGDQSDEQERPKREKKKRRHRKNRNNDVTEGERDVAVNLRRTGTCDPATVTVTPSLAVDSYAGEPVTLRLALSTTADAACELSLSEHEPLVSISEGSDTVWESERCDELIDTQSVRLEPGWRTYIDARWSGRTSGHACGENADFAEPGSYDINAAVLGGEPTSATVELAEKPEPDKQDKTEKQDKSDKGKPDTTKSDNDKSNTGKPDTDASDSNDSDDSDDRQDNRAENKNQDAQNERRDDASRQER